MVRARKKERDECLVETNLDVAEPLVVQGHSRSQLLASLALACGRGTRP